MSPSSDASRLHVQRELHLVDLVAHFEGSALRLDQKTLHPAPAEVSVFRYGLSMALGGHLGS